LALAPLVLVACSDPTSTAPAGDLPGDRGGVDTTSEAGGDAAASETGSDARGDSADAADGG
jgi:hypothetical protein